MFHTFETAQFNSPSQQEANTSSAAKRRTSTVRACEPCRKRKIRCNGEHPCETCQWYRKASSCHYTEPRQRQVPSRRSVEKISQTLQEYRAILQKLFPNVHPESLAALSRDKLIDIMSKSNPYQTPSPLSPGQDDKLSIHPDAGSLEQFQPLPEEPQDGFSRPCSQRTFTGISDHVNALSLTSKESSSYLGISSVMAALRVILWLDPDTQSFINGTAENNTFHDPPSSPHSIPEHPSSTTPTDSPKPSPQDEPLLISAYFTYIHPSTPLIDEATFRDMYATCIRSDSRWRLLVNTVLAIGAVASSTSASSTTHAYYFALARTHLTIDTLNSAHIETLQALALLSGIYLHYVSEPDLAHALMGATLRMATMLGLHRDFSEGLGPAKTAVQNISKASSRIEMRRRIWWSTFMLDAWASSTLGRPSMGRMSHAVTAKHPQEAIGSSELHLQLLRENVRLALISTRMEDSLAVSPLMDEIERQSLDNALVDWYQSSLVQRSSSGLQRLPDGINYSPHHDTTQQHNTPSSPGIAMTQNVMRWRYQLKRTILHRPALLWWAMRSRKFSTSALSSQKRAAIDLCRAVTAELTADIISTWQGPHLPACTMSAWHASAILYQAVMVPLLSLFSDVGDAAVLQESQSLVESSVAALREMSVWCRTAKRSLEVVSRLYEASRRHSPAQALSSHDERQELQEYEHDMLGSDPYAGSSASASVSGGMGSGDLGTPATLPSTVSTSSRGHHQRPTFIDLPTVSTTLDHPHSSQPRHHSHTTHPLLTQSHIPQPRSQPHKGQPQGHQGPAPAPFLTTPSSGSADMFMDTMLDSLNWSQGWSNNEYPFETPRLGGGWDYAAMNGWVGGVGGGGLLDDADGQRRVHGHSHAHGQMEVGSFGQGGLQQQDLAGNFGPGQRGSVSTGSASVGDNDEFRQAQHGFYH
ncbi:uncharacterized protein HMPREF1541_00390 [Cyphellophora europaea CBS 101466]|uniref:Zn(2)-C6 fungal-type domain-containing protein n=1 Tax=Cyphellophora europaea (strain CBS 101466) TaxID=1220924 RepID=W2SBU1_CYPE1|nr:uncharacterized protein HMPREF1541_00390 [Cyphellophora europaea CBS 101466]ETN46206.1 hypothetical protein HMPREF1541_00390 [Cyphellophora europaea CBS 101466]